MMISEHAERRQYLRTYVCALGVLLVCTAMAVFSDAGSPAHRPVLLSVAALLLWPATHSAGILRLQRIVGIYLFAAAVFSVHEEFVGLSLGQSELLIGVGLLLTVALVIARFLDGTVCDGCRDGTMQFGWPIALGLVSMYGIVLGLGLSMCYESSWDRSIRTVGGVVLVSCVFWVLWPVLAVLRARRLISVGVAVYYAMCSYV